MFIKYTKCRAFVLERNLFGGKVPLKLSSKPLKYGNIYLSLA